MELPSGGSDGPEQPKTQVEAPKFRYEGAKTKFEPSFLVQKPEDILKIKDRTLRRKVHVLHNAFVEDPTILTPEELRAEAKAIRQGIEAKTFKSQEADPVWKKLTAQAKKEEEAKQQSQKPESAFPKVDDYLLKLLTTEEAVEIALKAGRIPADIAKALIDRIRGGGKTGNQASPEPKTDSQPTQKAEPQQADKPETKQPETEPARPEHKNFSNMNYSQLRLALNDTSLSKETKEYIQAAMKTLEQQVRDFDQGTPFQEFKLQLTAHVEGHDWNDLQKGEENLDRKKNGWAAEFAANPGYNKRWDGVIQTAVEGAKARLLLAGISQRIDQSEKQGRDPNNDLDLQAWALRHKFDDQEIIRLQKVADEKNIFPDLLSDTPELQVGSTMPEVDKTYKNLQQQQSSTSQPGSQDKLAQLLERQISIDEQQLELLRKGYKGFIQVERVRAILNPEQFDQSLPPWYEELSPKEQEVIRARLSMNYWAAVKKKTGMVSMEQWNESQGITFERDTFDTMWRDKLDSDGNLESKEMPGFRIVMATMVKDVFDVYKKNPDGTVVIEPDEYDEKGKLKKKGVAPILQDHLVISGFAKGEFIRDKDGMYVSKKREVGGSFKKTKDPDDDTQKYEDSTEGYLVVQEPAKFVEYKKKLAKEIEAYLRPQEATLLQTYRGVTLSDLAQASVAAVDNMLFAGGAYDSGDEKRKITPGSADIYSEQVRAFFMPGVKGKVGKWLKDRDEETGKTDESFGGPLGEWIRDNAQANRVGFEIRTEQNGQIVLSPDKEGFKDRLQKNQIGLIPERFFYSLLDLTNFDKDEEEDLGKKNKWEKKSLAFALLHEPKKGITGAKFLQDYENGGSGIDISKLESAELLGSYADTRSDAVRIFNHIVGGDPKGRLDRSTLLTLLSRARGDKLLNPIFRNEDLVTAAVIMAASPERGLLKGTTEMVLDLPDYTLYDSIVTTNLSDNRIYEGMPAGFRQRLFKRLNAKDTTKFSAALGEAFGVQESIIGRRNSLRQQASTNLAQEAKRVR